MLIELGFGGKRRKMKSPLDKLKKFTLYKNDSKDKRNLQSSAQLDELAQAAKVFFFN